MKFGKEIQRLIVVIEEAMPDWKDQFLSYKLLKQHLKQHLKLIGSEHQGNVGAMQGMLSVPEMAFVRLLVREITKFNTFFMDKEEYFIIRHQDLNDKQGRTLEKEDLLKIWRDLIVLHGEMVLLENYSSLNYTGLVKILKKHDKHNKTGALLRLPFIQNVLHQPFFKIEQLSKLIDRCERNLCSLDLDLELESSDPLWLQDGEEIKRSTSAALQMIQHLRSGSSTYGPSSLPYQALDDDNSIL